MVKQENKIENYILKAIDLESISEDKLLIILRNNKRVLLSGVSDEIKDWCYDIFGKKFRNNRKNKVKVLWTSEEIEFLKNNYMTMDIDKLNKKLNKSHYQINLMLKKMNILTKKNWDKEEIDFLKKNIDKTSTWLAMNLNRSIASIKAKKRVIKLSNI